MLNMKETVIKKILLVKKYLQKVEPYLEDIINNLRKFDMWKIELTLPINVISTRDNNEERVMNSKSDIKEITINEKADKVIEKRFKSLLNRYPKQFRNIDER